MKEKIVDPQIQLESARSFLKGFKEHSEEEQIDIPQTLFFFNEYQSDPLAFLHLPFVQNQSEKEVMFKMAFGSLRAFQTTRMILASDVWQNTAFETNEDMQKWYDSGKTLSEHPLSEQALMTVMYTKDMDVYSLIDTYSFDDKGKMFFKSQNDMDLDMNEAQGLVPSIAKQAYDILYDDKYVHDTKSTNQYFAMLDEMGFGINMSDMMFEILGLKDHQISEDE